MFFSTSANTPGEDQGKRTELKQAHPWFPKSALKDLLICISNPMTVNTAERKKKKKEVLVWWSKQVRYFICEIQMFILALSSSEAILKTT